MEPTRSHSREKLIQSRNELSFTEDRELCVKIIHNKRILTKLQMIGFDAVSFSNCRAIEGVFKLAAFIGAKLYDCEHNYSAVEVLANIYSLEWTEKAIEIIEQNSPKKEPQDECVPWNM